MKAADVIRAADLLRVCREIREDLLPELDKQGPVDVPAFGILRLKDTGAKAVDVATGDGGEGAFVVVSSVAIGAALAAVLADAEGELRRLGVEP